MQKIGRKRKAEPTSVQTTEEKNNRPNFGKVIKLQELNKT